MDDRHRNTEFHPPAPVRTFGKVKGLALSNNATPLASRRVTLFLYFVHEKNGTNSGNVVVRSVWQLVVIYWLRVLLFHRLPVPPSITINKSLREFKMCLWVGKGCCGNLQVCPSVPSNNS
jgi:hypothetical protein